jgi:hypothetical protein
MCVFCFDCILISSERFPATSLTVGRKTGKGFWDLDVWLAGEVDQVFWVWRRWASIEILKVLYVGIVVKSHTLVNNSKCLLVQRTKEITPKFFSYGPLKWYLSFTTPWFSSAFSNISLWFFSFSSSSKCRTNRSRVMRRHSAFLLKSATPKRALLKQTDKLKDYLTVWNSLRSFNHRL